jgi:hypothetical protein
MSLTTSLAAAIRFPDERNPVADMPLMKKPS